MVKLDVTDKKLLNILQENSDYSLKELSGKLNLTMGPINERIKKLKKAGVIDRYIAVVNGDLIGKGLISFCAVRVDKHKMEQLKGFEDKVQEMNEVLECFTVSGEYDYLLKVVSKSMDDYQDFVINKLSRLDMIQNMNSQFAMKKVKHGHKLHLDL